LALFSSFEALLKTRIGGSLIKILKKKQLLPSCEALLKTKIGGSLIKIFKKKQE
jgi:hypothetical protein